MKVKQIIGFLEKATKLRKKSFVELTKKDVKALRKPKRKVKIKPERTAEKHEVEGFKQEVAVSALPRTAVDTQYPHYMLSISVSSNSEH